MKKSTTTRAQTPFKTHHNFNIDDINNYIKKTRKATIKDNYTLLESIKG